MLLEQLLRHPIGPRSRHPSAAVSGEASPVARHRRSADAPVHEVPVTA
jgi:hypothetical protein